MNERQVDTPARAESAPGQALAPRRSQSPDVPPSPGLMTEANRECWDWNEFEEPKYE